MNFNPLFQSLETNIKKNNADSALHIAIIMDGNGRWALDRNLNRTEGHKQGIQALHEILDNIPKNVSILTVYAFSLENWSRSIMEVYNIMTLSYNFLNKHLQTFIDKGIKVQCIGEISLLPFYIINLIKKIEQKTKNGKNLLFNIAISYGSRQEIWSAIEKYTETKDINALNKDGFEKHLSTYGIPDPDILIRTGGEKRLSNYLLWQLAYTELFFIDTLWPNFNLTQLTQIIQEYNERNRRYGFVA